MKKLKMVMMMTLMMCLSFISFGQAKFGSLVERGESDSYVGSDGVEYTVGDTIKIGMPTGLRSFSFVQSLDVMGTATFASFNFSNTEVVIKKIRIVGSQRIGFKASFQTKATVVSNLFIDFESALKSGEVTGKRGTISSDDAISELKKQKDKLDLGIITQEEYDAKKSELLKYIK